MPLFLLLHPLLQVLLEDPLLQVLLLLKQAEEMATDVMTGDVEVGEGEGLMDKEMDHGDSVRGKEVTSQGDTIVQPMNYCTGWNLLPKF